MLLNRSQKPTATHYKILFLSWAGWIFDFYDLMLFAFLQHSICGALSIPEVFLSLVMGVSLAATALGGMVFGTLSDHFGRKKALQWTILAYSCGTFLCGLSWNGWSLLAFRIVTGLGVGGEWATGQTYIGETFPAQVRGRFGSFMQTGAPLGIALASLVAGFFLPPFGWRACFFLSFLPALLVVLVRRHLPESDLWEAKKRLPSRTGIKTKSKLMALFTPAYRQVFFSCLVLAFFEMSAYWFTYSWLPGYLNEQRHFSMTKSMIWFLVLQTGGFLGYFFFGFFADRFGRKPAFTVYALCWASGLLMVTWFWDAVVGTPSVILFFMFLVGVGTGMFGGIGPLFAELFPTAIRNTAMGSAFNLARGVQLFTPMLIYWIAQYYDLGVGISLAAFFALGAGAWIWVFPETKGKVLND